MTDCPHRKTKPLAHLAALALALLLGAAPVAASAQEAVTGGETIGRILDVLKMRAPPAPAPEFVLETRPDASKLDYMPLAPPPRPAPPNKAAGDAIEADLVAAAAKAKARAARVGVPDSGAPAPRRNAKRGG
jgi:hypothetical protein